MVRPGCAPCATTTTTPFPEQGSHFSFVQAAAALQTNAAAPSVHALFSLPSLFVGCFYPLPRRTLTDIPHYHLPTVERLPASWTLTRWTTDCGREAYTFLLAAYLNRRHYA